MTPLDPNLLSISGIGNATIDGDGLSGFARGQLMIINLVEY